MDELKKQAEALGIKVDGRWSEDRLREEIEEAQALKDEADKQAEIDAEAKAKADKEAQDKADEEARVAAQEKADKEAQEKAEQEAEEKRVKDAQEQADLDAKAQADLDAQAQALEQEVAEGSVTIINLQANPMLSLGLEGYGKAVLVPSQLDAITRRRIDRGIELGLLKVEE